MMVVVMMVVVMMIMVMMMRVVMRSRYMGIRMSQVERTVRKNSDAGGHNNDGGHGDDEKERQKEGSVVQNVENFDQQRLHSLYNLVDAIVQIY